MDNTALYKLVKEGGIPFNASVAKGGVAGMGAAALLYGLHQLMQTAKSTPRRQIPVDGISNLAGPGSLGMGMARPPMKPLG